MILGLFAGVAPEVVGPMIDALLGGTDRVTARAALPGAAAAKLLDTNMTEDERGAIRAPLATEAPTG